MADPVTIPHERDVHSPWYDWNIHELNNIFVECKELPEGLAGFIQLLFLGAVYFKLLMFAADEIGEGERCRRQLLPRSVSWLDFSVAIGGEMLMPSSPRC